MAKTTAITASFIQIRVPFHRRIVTLRATGCGAGSRRGCGLEPLLLATKGGRSRSGVITAGTFALLVVATPPVPFLGNRYEAAEVEVLTLV